MIKSLVIALATLISSECFAQSENIAWSKTLYSELSLTERANMPLFSLKADAPSVVTNKGLYDTKGLFSTLFRLALQSRIPVYKYTMDGMDRLNEITKTDFKHFLKDFDIPYRTNGDTISILKEVIPFEEVKSYYIREQVYYNATNSSFHTKVTAICPVMLVKDEYNGEITKYPMFWVNYNDIRPWLKLQLITDYSNTASEITMDDFFRLNLYKGSIYKLDNPMGQSLIESASSTEQLDSIRNDISSSIELLKKRTYKTNN